MDCTGGAGVRKDGQEPSVPPGLWLKLQAGETFPGVENSGDQQQGVSQVETSVPPTSWGIREPLLVP